MTWLHEHGVISNWWEYDALPASVLDDARMLIEHDAQAADRRRQESGRQRGGRR